MSGPDVTSPKKPPEQHLKAVHDRLVGRARVRRANTPGIFVRRYQYSPQQIPGWVVQRARTIEPTGRRNVLRFSQLTLAAAGDPSQLVKLDVYETPSPEAASELMVELLTGYQSLPGRVELAEDVGDADVAFPGDRTRIFTRGNLVILLVHAGGSPRAVGDLARALDEFLVAAPTRATPARAAAAPAAAATEMAPAEAMTRYMASSGTLRQEADGSIVAEDSADPPAVSTCDAHSDGWRAGNRPPKAATPRRARPGRKKR